jgi:hypothetical protein
MELLLEILLCFEIYLDFLCLFRERKEQELCGGFEAAFS